MLVLFSDWNGSKRGHVYKFLRSQGFVSSYDTAHQYTDADSRKVNIFNPFPHVKLHVDYFSNLGCALFYYYLSVCVNQWVSHRNHRGNICGVDFIWLLNPNGYRKLLKTSWSEAIFGMFKVTSSPPILIAVAFNFITIFATV